MHADSLAQSPLPGPPTNILPVTCCQTEGRAELLQQLLGSMDASNPPFVEPPFMCDYGSNIHIGAGVSVCVSDTWG